MSSISPTNNNQSEPDSLKISPSSKEFHIITVNHSPNKNSAVIHPSITASVPAALKTHAAKESLIKGEKWQNVTLDNAL